MKKMGEIILLIFISSCSVKHLTVTPVNSDRGDAVFGLIVPDNNYGKIEDIHIYSWTQGGELNVNRVLIDFNLDKIPSTAIVDSAFLSLYYNSESAYNKINGKKGSQGQDKIVIQRVINEWNEQDVTWNKQPETTTQNQVVIEKKEDNLADYTNIDITGIIQDMVKNESGRFGIMVRHQEEVPYNVVFFASGDHADKSLHPKLEVFYRKK